MLLLLSADFFQLFLSKKIFQKHCQSSNGLDPDQDLIWVQTVCKDYPALTISQQRVKDDVGTLLRPDVLGVLLSVMLASPAFIHYYILFIAYKRHFPEVLRN